MQAGPADEIWTRENLREAVISAWFELENGKPWY